MRGGAFTVIPAVDIKGGRCVRLWQGDMDRETVYSDHPEEAALRWEREGASLIHLVDLDGAVSGRMDNRRAIERILAAVSVPVEVGGGIRDRATMDSYLELGVRRMVLGTAACRHPEKLPELLEGFAGEVWIGIDARDGLVAVDGWRETLAMTAAEMALAASEAGAAGVIYTDISRDGTLEGPNVRAMELLLAETDLPVVASGGVATLEDIRTLAALAAKQSRLPGIGTTSGGGPPRLEGVIVGRALYTGDLDLAAALAVAREPF